MFIVVLDVGSVNLGWVVYDTDVKNIITWEKNFVCEVDEPIRNKCILVVDFLKVNLFEKYLANKSCIFWCEHQLENVLRNSILETNIRSFCTSSGIISECISFNLMTSLQKFRLTKTFFDTFNKKYGKCFWTPCTKSGNMKSESVSRVSECALHPEELEPHIANFKEFVDMFIAASKKDDLSDVLIMLLAIIICGLHLVATKKKIIVPITPREHTATGGGKRPAKKPTEKIVIKKSKLNK